MKVLIGYATHQGQTRKIARLVAAQIIDAGNSVELIPLIEALDIDLGSFDRVVLAASVHANEYQRSLTEFAAQEVDRLNRMPSLFSLEVSANRVG
ncbi:hypothetical protein AYJ57_20435 (plasmid) [Salipiger sp. CCB-MM3]|uniref:flavodoxin domain-containing protein n=1 Tax=Salipiger sp. CCB-MM3 TaxID=1792508 RepID=UPI00080A9D52|nr:flavodoxin domain-containing protein [Salipiger sp. CCB-MM3]ANT62859.1 hypothetical protein AYJ57_20435 [Salipiger sp. CCB-MM3]